MVVDELTADPTLIHLTIAIVIDAIAELIETFKPLINETIAVIISPIAKLRRRSALTDQLTRRTSRRYHRTLIRRRVSAELIRFDLNL
jgi:hypothetical protein